MPSIEIKNSPIVVGVAVEGSGLPMVDYRKMRILESPSGRKGSALALLDELLGRAGKEGGEDGEEDGEEGLEEGLAKGLDKGNVGASESPLTRPRQPLTRPTPPLAHPNLPLPNLDDSVLGAGSKPKGPEKRPADTQEEMKDVDEEFNGVRTVSIGDHPLEVEKALFEEARKRRKSKATSKGTAKGLGKAGSTEETFPELTHKRERGDQDTGVKERKRSRKDVSSERKTGKKDGPSERKRSKKDGPSKIPLRRNSVSSSSESEGSNPTKTRKPFPVAVSTEGRLTRSQVPEKLQSMLRKKINENGKYRIEPVWNKRTDRLFSGSDSSSGTESESEPLAKRLLMRNGDGKSERRRLPSEERVLDKKEPSKQPSSKTATEKVLEISISDCSKRSTATPEPTTRRSRRHHNDDPLAVLSGRTRSATRKPTVIDLTLDSSGDEAVNLDQSCEGSDSTPVSKAVEHNGTVSRVLQKLKDSFNVQSFFGISKGEPAKSKVELKRSSKKLTNDKPSNTKPMNEPVSGSTETEPTAETKIKISDASNEDKLTPSPRVKLSPSAEAKLTPSSQIHQIDENLASLLKSRTFVKENAKVMTFHGVPVNYTIPKIQPKPVYSSSCISCLTKGRDRYCNREIQCDFCCKTDESCQYPRSARVINQDEIEMYTKVKSMKESGIWDRRRDVIGKEADGDIKKLSIKRVGATRKRKSERQRKEEERRVSSSDSQVVTARDELLGDNKLRGSFEAKKEKTTKIGKGKTAKAGKGKTKSGKAKTTRTGKEKHDKATTEVTTKITTETTKIASEDRPHSTELSDSAEDMEYDGDSEADYIPPPTHHKRRTRRSARESIRGHTSAGLDEEEDKEVMKELAGANTQTIRVLQNLNFENRDLTELFEDYGSRRRRRATRENYLELEDVDLSDLSSGERAYKEAEASAEPVILSDDETERRMLRGQLPLDFVEGMTGEEGNGDT
ncbi:DEKNAAC104424 [Brettanomyces naardenensis]|uniref:DEKNAAC104424 n=1 Tax=Brettanomyces naardenensis TaxID=13370 RepID=A0A448YQS6_BRENA|nr:DEKNAAC104424 [Brettanomyces naardenensis]